MQNNKFSDETIQRINQNYRNALLKNLELNNRINSVFKNTPPALAIVNPQIKDSLHRVNSLLDSPILKQAIKNIASAFRFIFPENIRTCLNNEIFTVDDLLNFIEEYSIGIYQVPKSDVLGKLINSANNNEVAGVLLQHKDELIDECLIILNKLEKDEDYSEIKNFALESISAFRSGHPTAAQTLLAVTLEKFINTFVPDIPLQKSLKTKRPETKSEELLEGVPTADYLILAPIHNAFRYYKFNTHIVPQSFNRHATIHNPGIESINSINFIHALLLITSCLRFISDHKKGS